MPAHLYGLSRQLPLQHHPEHVHNFTAVWASAVWTALAGVPFAARDSAVWTAVADVCSAALSAIRRLPWCTAVGNGGRHCTTWWSLGSMLARQGKGKGAELGLPIGEIPLSWAPLIYGWIGQRSSSGFFDRPPATLGQIHF